MLKVYKGKLNTVISSVLIVSTFLIIFYVVLDVISFSRMNKSVTTMLTHFEIKEIFVKIINIYDSMENDFKNYYFLNHEKVSDYKFDNYIKNLNRMYRFSRGDQCIYKDYGNDFNNLKDELSLLKVHLRNYQDILSDKKPDNDKLIITINKINNSFDNIRLVIHNIEKIHNVISKNESKIIYMQIRNNKKIRYILVILSVVLILSLFIIKSILKDKFKAVKNILLSPERFTKQELQYDYDDEFTSIIDSYLHMHKQTLNSIKEIDFLKDYLQSIINCMPSIIIAMDENLKITQWNKNAERVTGLDFISVKYKHISEVLPFFKNYEDKLNDVNIKKNNFIVNYFHDTENLCLFKEIKSIWNIIVYPLCSNGLNDIVIKIDDVSDIEQKEQLLRQAQKMEMVGTLAGGLSHDFNNILGGIIATLSILFYKIKKSNTDESHKNTQINTEFIIQQIELLMELSEKAADLVKQLLTLSRKHEISLTPLDLNLSVKRVVKICKNSFDKSIEFNMSYYPESANIIGDLNQVEQVLLNVFINAGHAMTIMRMDKPSSYDKSGGILSVKINLIDDIKSFLKEQPAFKEFSNSYSTLSISNNPEDLKEKYWIISISDTGVGIDKYNMAKIFDPFFTTKKKDSGTGLGLSMVYNIIHKHNGFIEIFSEIDKGTLFNIYLPVYSCSSKASDIIKVEKIQTNVNENNKNNIILVIEDDTVLRDIMNNILSECGFKVLTAVDGKEGISIIKRLNHELDIVIVDMIMPVQSGLDVIKYIKTEMIKCDIILTSGHNQDNRIVMAKEFGVSSYLSKPFTMHKLVLEVNDILAKKV